MAHSYVLGAKPTKAVHFVQGLGLTLLLALSAKYVAQFPFLSIMGQLVIAILLGMVWRAAIGAPQRTMTGIAFSSRRLLRIGIILLGMRLNGMDILRAGPRVLAISVIAITFTLTVVYGLSKLFQIDRRLGILTACGTAICGAAAVVAISPQIKATNEETAISAAIVAILGTIFTLIYTFLYPVLGLSPFAYGVFAGGTLHEVAHVIAAAAPGGKEAVDIAVIVKLTRVGLLVPVAVMIGLWTNRLDRKAGGAGMKASWKAIPIPWFIVGFLMMCGLNTTGIVPPELSNGAVTAAYLLIAMAMAGLGLNVDFQAFRRMGMKPFTVALIGSVLLSGLGYALIYLFRLHA